MRELREELAIVATVGARLAESGDGRIRIELFAVTSVTEPVRSADHDRLRWLDAAELDAVAWLPLDRALLPAVRALLEGDGQG